MVLGPTEEKDAMDGAGLMPVAATGGNKVPCGFLCDLMGKKKMVKQKCVTC